jgi:hypothetical protein
MPDRRKFTRAGTGVRSRSETMKRPRWSVLALGLSAALSCADDPTAVVPPCGEAPTLVAGQAVNGTLGPGTARRGGSYIQHYTVWPTDSMDLRIEMRSVAVEPFLLLFDPSGQVIAQAIGEPTAVGGHAAILVQRLAGCHTVGATTWAPDSRGGYILRMEGEPAGGS